MRMKDLVDQYEPDMLYTDGPLPFEDYGLSLIGHLPQPRSILVYPRAPFHGFTDLRVALTVGTSASLRESM